MTIEPPKASAPSQIRLMQAKEWIRRRTAKYQYFPPAIFSGPAWPMFLDLYTSELESGDRSVAAACSNAGVPMGTALRWIDVLIEAGFLRRLDANLDTRRALLGVTDKGVDAMDRMLDAIEKG